LLEKQNIKLIGSATDASADTFKYNPYLTPVFTNTETTIYAFQPPAPGTAKDNEADFLLLPTTIANDLGDAEDTQAYSAISINATRISDPIFRDSRTLREIQSVDGTIRLNVGNYVAPVWHKDNANNISTPLKLLMRLQNNGAETTIKFNDKEITTFNTPKDEKFSDVAINLPGGTLNYNNKGFVNLTLTIKHGPLVADLIAIGPAK
jgi:hypothetical protein